MNEDIGEIGLLSPGPRGLGPGPWGWEPCPYFSEAHKESGLKIGPFQPAPGLLGPGPDRPFLTRATVR